MHSRPSGATRLGMVRRFARYAHAVDPRHEVPPQGLLPERYRRRQPYLYRDTEIAELIAAAQELSGATGLRPLTYATMLGLLSVTGMRVSEVLNLGRDDVDLTGGVLTVRDSKFGKSRYLPVHTSTTQALSRYARRRDRPCPNPLAPAFFLAERGTPITQWALRWTFAKLSKQVGLRAPSKSHGTGCRCSAGALHARRSSVSASRRAVETGGSAGGSDSPGAGGAPSASVWRRRGTSRRATVRRRPCAFAATARWRRSGSE